MKHFAKLAFCLLLALSMMTSALPRKCRILW